MSLSCGCDGEHYVELDPDYMSIAPNTIVCRECRCLIPPGADYYRVRLWKFGDWIPDSFTPWIDEGDEVETGVREVCEDCGDLAYTVLELGYCYAFGSLRADVREMAAIELENRLEHEAWKKRQEAKNGTN
jgi:hypothetical protein